MEEYSAIIQNLLDAKSLDDVQDTFRNNFGDNEINYEFTDDLLIQNSPFKSCKMLWISSTDKVMYENKPILLVHDPHLKGSSLNNSIRAYFSKILSYNDNLRSFLNIQGVGRKQRINSLPSLYIVFGENRVVMYSPGKNRDEFFSIHPKTRVTSQLVLKLTKLKFNNLELKKHRILGNYFDTEFLFESAELDAEFINNMTKIKVKLVKNVIHQKSLCIEIGKELDINIDDYDELIKLTSFQQALISVIDTIILKSILERFIVANFGEILTEDIKLHFEKIDNSVKLLKIQEILDRDKYQAQSSLFDFFGDDEELIVDHQIKELHIKKDEMMKDLVGGDFYYGLLSKLNSKVVKKLDANLLGALQELSKEDRYNWNYQDLHPQVIQQYYESAMEKIPFIKQEEDGSLDVELLDSKIASKVAGAFYTDVVLCKKMVELGLGKLLHKSIISPLEELIISIINVNKISTEDFNKIKSILKKFLSLKIVDPAMGAGIFLRESFLYMSQVFQRVIEILLKLENQFSKILENNLTETEFSLFLMGNKDRDEKLADWEWYVLKNCIYGVDLDIKAVYIASQMLTLSCLRHIKAGMNFPSFVNLGLKKGNSLISPIALTLEGTNGLAATYKPQIKKIIKIREKIRSSETYDEISKLIDKNNIIQGEIRTELIAQRLIKIDKKEYSTQVISSDLVNSPEVSSFIWQLEYPEVFFNNEGRALDEKEHGFNFIVGNPPWESWRFVDNEFFHKFDATFRSIKHNTVQRTLKRELLENDKINSLYNRGKKVYSETKKYFLLNYSLLGLGKGSTLVNLYKLFFERFLQLINGDPSSYWTIIIPGAILGDISGKIIREKILHEYDLTDILEIITGKAFFPRVHSGISCIIISAHKGETNKFNIVAKIRNTNDLTVLNNVPCTVDLIYKYAPQDKFIPMMNSVREFTVLDKIYKFPVLSDRYWNGEFTRGLDRKDDSDLYSKNVTNIPLIEGVSLTRFGVEIEKAKYYVDTTLSKRNIDIKNYKRTKTYNTKFIGWRDISANDYRRRMYVSVFDEYSVTSSKILHLYNLSQETLSYVAACLNSMVIEFRARQISYGLSMPQYIVKKLPIPKYNASNSIVIVIEEKVKIFGPKAKQWARDNVGANNPQRIANEWKYSDELSEIDALVALVYNLNLGDFKVVLKAHPKVWKEYKELAVKHYKGKVKELKLGDEYLEDDTGITFDNDPRYNKEEKK